MAPGERVVDISSSVGIDGPTGRPLGSTLAPEMRTLAHKNPIAAHQRSVPQSKFEITSLEDVSVLASIPGI